MLRCSATKKGLIAACLLLCASVCTYPPKAQEATRLPAGMDLMTLKLTPNKWFHEANGDVRSIETTEYRLVQKDGRMIEARTRAETSYFDRRGFETESVEGQDRTIWKYDARGRVAEMSISIEGAPFTRDVYFYDLEHRRVTVESYYFGSDKPLLREVSIFDERWNEIRKETERFGDGKSREPGKDVVVYNLTYDSRGRVIASSIADERGAVSHRFAEEFDDANRVIKSTSYEYDESSGRLLTKSISTYEKGGLVGTYSHYDARGRLMRRETITRELDARGNWMTEKRVTQVYDEGTPRSFTIIKRRKITYY